MQTCIDVINTSSPLNRMFAFCTYEIENETHFFLYNSYLKRRESLGQTTNTDKRFNQFTLYFPHCLLRS